MNPLRFSPWIFLIVVSLVLALLPIWPDPLGVTSAPVALTQYVISWVGGAFQAISGALIGLFFVRRVMKLDLSAIENDRDRAHAALGASLIIFGFTVGVCVAV